MWVPDRRSATHRRHSRIGRWPVARGPLLANGESV